MSGATIDRITNGATINRTTSTTTIDRVLGATTLTAGTSAPQGRIRYLSTFAGTDPTGTTDCNAAITAAIATTAAAGQVLIIDGTYLCSDMVTLASGATLMGLGWQQSVLQFDWDTQTPNNSYLFGLNLSNITITGLRILGAGDGTPWGGNDQSGPVCAGIRLSRCTGVRVEANRFHNVPGLNLIFSRVQRATAAHNHITGAGRDGIHITNLGTDISEDITVEGNTIHTLGDDGIALNAGTATNGTAATLSTTAGSVTVTGSGTTFVAGDVGKLIAIDGADSGAMFEAIIATRVSDTEITIDRKAPTTVAGASGTYGFARMKGIRLIGNTIMGQATSGDPLTSGRGIYVAGAEGVAISGNTIRNTHGVGIEFDDDEEVPYIYAKGCTVAGNTIIGAGLGNGGVNPSNQHGIRLYAVMHTTVTGNTIIDCVQSGIAVARTTDTVIASNVIEGSGDGEAGYGINLSGDVGGYRVARVKVDGNHVSRSWATGIRVHFATMVTVSNNTCVDNGRSGQLGTDDVGIALRGAGTWVVTGNHCHDTRPVGARSQRLGILVGNDGGSPKVHLHNNICVDNNAAPGISLNNSGAQVWQSGNHSSTADLSASFQQWDTVKDVRGTGSPEGVVTAGIGSTFRRTDGGASTSLYIKESGTGNTGWVAK